MRYYKYTCRQFCYVNGGEYQTRTDMPLSISF